LGVVLLLSACGGASLPKLPPKVPPSLRSFIFKTTAGFPGGTLAAIDVYGPGTRAALVKASMGNIPHSSVGYIRNKWGGKGFYLVVFHGQFFCGGCGSSHSLQTPQAAIEVWVWSPLKGQTDWAIMKNLLPAVTGLHRLAKVALT
jgi:hypothetical protein